MQQYEKSSEEFWVNKNKAIKIAPQSSSSFLFQASANNNFDDNKNYNNDSFDEDKPK